MTCDRDKPTHIFLQDSGPEISIKEQTMTNNYFARNIFKHLLLSYFNLMLTGRALAKIRRQRRAIRVSRRRQALHRPGAGAQLERLGVDHGRSLAAVGSIARQHGRSARVLASRRAAAGKIRFQRTGPHHRRRALEKCAWYCCGSPLGKTA